MTMTSSHTGLFSGVTMSGTPLTTSARISALNIVGELLRKVGVSHNEEPLVVITVDAGVFESIMILWNFPCFKM